MELSINSKCNLQCNHCGFNIPNQPNPTINSDVIAEHSKSLAILKGLNINIETLAILGGEPSLSQELLEQACETFSKFENVTNIEVVTNGLNPKGITKNVLNNINKLSVSVYFNSKLLIDLWNEYIKQHAPHVHLAFRIDKSWDQYVGDITVSNEKAQRMYSNCWYRKHCVTLERKRLFMCTRAAKTQSDGSGLILHNNLKTSDVINYLNQARFIDPCKGCIPMMGLDKIKAGKQTKPINIDKLVASSIKILKNRIQCLTTD